MNAPDQLALFSPTGPEVLPLALSHQRKAVESRRWADKCRARSWSALEAVALDIAHQHEQEAECLAMLADFERLAGITGADR